MSIIWSIIYFIFVFIIKEICLLFLFKYLLGFELSDVICEIKSLMCYLWFFFVNIYENKYIIIKK